MPAVSQAQRAYLNARFGHAWVRRHHYANTGKLPARAAPVRSRRRVRARAGATTRRRRH